MFILKIKKCLNKIVYILVIRGNMKRQPKIRIGPISGRKLKTAKQLLAEDPITGRLKREIDDIEKKYQEDQKKNKKKLKKKLKKKKVTK